MDIAGDFDTESAAGLARVLTRPGAEKHGKLYMTGREGMCDLRTQLQPSGRLSSFRLIPHGLSKGCENAEEEKGGIFKKSL